MKQLFTITVDGVSFLGYADSVLEMLDYATTKYGQDAPIEVAALPSKASWKLFSDKIKALEDSMELPKWAKCREPKDNEGNENF